MPDRDDEDDDRPRRPRRRPDDAGEDDRPRRRPDDDEPDAEAADRPRRRRQYDDEDDDRPRRRRRPPPPADDETLSVLLPVNTPVLAVAAGYLGLLSVLCLPAPFALLTGILALRQLSRDRQYKGYGRGMGYVRALVGVVLGGIGTLALVAFGVAAAVGGLK